MSLRHSARYTRFFMLPKFLVALTITLPGSCYSFAHTSDSTQVPLEAHSPFKKAYLLDTGISGFVQIYYTQQIVHTNKVCISGYLPKGSVNLVQTDSNASQDVFHDISKIALHAWQDGYSIDADQVYAITPLTFGPEKNTSVQFAWTFYCIPT